MKTMQTIKALCLTLLSSSFGPYCFAAEQEMRSSPKRAKTEAYAPSTAQSCSEEIAHLLASNKKMDCADFQVLCKSFLSHKENSVNMPLKERGNLTLLHITAAKGYHCAVESLLEAGASVHAQTDDLFTPLHLAAGNGHVGIVQSLLAKRALIDSKTAEGGTPFFYAAGNGHLDVASYLVTEGTDKATQDNKGGTALHFAVCNGRIDMAKLLLDKKAEIDARTVEEDTPLHYAAANGKHDMVASLLKRNANIEAENKDLFTPLHFAVVDGNLDTVETLLTAGAHKEAENKFGSRALHLASFHGHCDLIPLLIRHHCNKNAEASTGDTSLSLIAEKASEGEAKQRKIFDLLLEAGAECSFDGGKKKVLHGLLLLRKNASRALLAEDPALDMIKKLLNEGVGLTCEDVHFARSRGDAPATAAIEAEIKRRRDEPHPAETAEAITSMVRDACDLDEKGLARYIQQSAQSSRDVRLLKEARKE